MKIPAKQGCVKFLAGGESLRIADSEENLLSNLVGFNRVKFKVQLEVVDFSAHISY